MRSRIHVYLIKPLARSVRASMKRLKQHHYSTSFFGGGWFWLLDFEYFSSSNLFRQESPRDIVVRIYGER